MALAVGTVGEFVNVVTVASVPLGARRDETAASMRASSVVSSDLVADAIEAAEGTVGALVRVVVVAHKVTLATASVAALNVLAGTSAVPDQTMLPLPTLAAADMNATWYVPAVPVMLPE